MKKHFYKLIFTVFSFQSALAQYVTIPDANLRAHLKAVYPSCFNASNQLDTNCSGVRNATILELNGKNISYLEGVQYFDNLVQLWSSKNNLLTITAFPPRLEQIDLGENLLTTLPKLPNTLRQLTCNKNKLTTLPSLPANLQLLNVENNLLTDLPSLPNTITELYCRSNKISSLPTLPMALVSLYCATNDLSSLPTLPTGLVELVANANCFNPTPSNPNPSKLTTFTVSPNKANCTVGLDEELSNTSQYTYPNPFTANLFANVSGLLKIYQSDGREIMSIQVNANEPIHTEQLTAGFYHYQLNGTTGKIAKE